MSDRLAQDMGPETVLAAVFAQAFTGGGGRLPAGITRADLRAALSLEPAAQVRIYEQIRSRFQAHSSPASGAAPAEIIRPVWLAAAGAALFAAFVAFFVIPRPLPHNLPAPAELAVPALPQGQPAAPLHLAAPEAASVLASRAAQDPLALAELQARAATGEAAAAYQLATLLDGARRQDETTLPKDDAAAFQLYQQAALNGDVEAEYATGQAYQSGHGVQPDAALATAWYRAAALGGLAPAQASLGLAYETGLGIPPDAGQAAYWLGRAAAQRDPAAETELGYLYVYGQGVSPDIGRAVGLFTQAAAQKFPSADLALGLAYAQGQGVAQDVGTAAHYFLLAAQSGAPEARAAMARLALQTAGAP